MKLYIKSISILIFAILFAGCSFKQDLVEQNKYSINFSTNKVEVSKKVDSIFIEEPNVNKSFNQTAILYSNKEFLFEEYAKNRWISSPSNMIYNQLIDSFNSSNIFKNIISKDKRIEYKYLLRSEVLKLYQVFEEDSSYAVIKVNFYFIENNKTIKTYNFDKKIICEKNSAYGFVKAVNIGFEEIINSLIEDIKL
ncbi:ABC-type transport auxiliary lipoprotein family protein [Arcobacter porcinus]|uniref:Putative lipid asymmetry ABC transporter MlaABCDEF component MlaB n=1 Tax=Arcobacter porcinus TaxID=1935204 RepID=A0A5C2HA08_9BACT|nr:hypothetical protein [Arcobacter porcinus]OCL97214.1 hypothetical protein AAX27_00121 [Aliarcobacter thereius]QEP39786.1 putative lipid asymmetry ABC transporter MlaABCDEF component MlaB [Arcobacter porcinus]